MDSYLMSEISSILGGCVEAICEDGCHPHHGGIMMSGTGATYTALVIERAGQHAEATGHRTRVRTWADD